eukprot:TRINITY_DN57284_c0_g1_i1.p1 TRINITY_DN57284_c0_g1~~TRINITY_DN57284_c0_g1_i1.p1  ORF type:complete len:432 (+),score=109.49 TRINITY_DN57284_c0_g1_i1:35-1330(+)
MEVVGTIQTLVVHSAWRAANERFFLRAAAERDRRIVEDAATELKRLLPEEHARVILGLASHASWQAANTRRFFRRDADNDRRSKDFYAGLLCVLMSSELGDAIRCMADHAAWHAANTRSMLWRDAARDAKAFEEAAQRLPVLLERYGQARDASTQKRDAGDQLPAADDRSEVASTVGSVPEEGVYTHAVRQSGSFARRASSFSSAAVPEAAAAPGAPLSAPPPGILQRTSCILDDVILAWQDVVISDDGVGCASFLQAADATVVVFDCFGRVLAPLQDDMRGNIEAIRKNLSVAADSATVERMLVEEGALAGSLPLAAKKGSTALSLLWLVRPLRLLEIAMLEYFENDKRRFSQCVNIGYTRTLKPHHDWLTRNLVGAGIRTAPSRKNFTSMLSPDLATAEAAMKRLLEVYSPVLRSLHEYLCESGLESAR